MKNKIKAFAKGDFQMERPEIVFSETHITMVVCEGASYKGSFIIENQKDGVIRGIVYPSSFRVHFANQGFEGNPVEVAFTYDSTGMKPGQVEQGKFTVVCNGGEYDITFTAIVDRPFITTEYGKIRNVADFSKVAKIDFTEAKRLFKSRQFYDVLKYEEPRILHLYTNMRKWALDEQALEEFLVGIKQKEKIYLTLSEERVELQDILENCRQSIEIEKNTWGYLLIKVYAEGDFLQVDNGVLTTEAFGNNSYSLNYTIKAEALHKGYNYGVIYIETPYETLQVQVTVHQQHQRDENYGMLGMAAGQALKHYMALLSGKIDDVTWRDRTLHSISKMQEYEPENPYYMIMKAHVNLLGERKDDAVWLMEKVSSYRITPNKNPEVAAYYLFVNALIKEEVVYRNKVIDDITRLYMKYPYTWELLYMLVHLEPRYKDPGERIRVYERQFSNGANHVLMFADAYLAYQENVVLLRKMGAFEIHVLDFATKYKIISKEVALYMAELIGHQKRYDKRFVRVLIRAYRMFDDTRILYAICNQLIKGNRTDRGCFKWYAKAIAKELKIAQLYEFYLQSLDEEKFRGPLPRIVYLYFLHGNQLDYKKTALLYADILNHESEESEIYKNYADRIKEFAWEQLLKRHINESLRVIYNRFLNEQDMKPEHIEALRDVCYAYSVKTDRTDMKYVLVIEKDGSVVQRVPHKENGAIVYLYDKAARIVWESADGAHYTDSIPYDTKRLFYEITFMGMVRKYQDSDGGKLSGEGQPTADIENLKNYGLEAFDKQEVFVLCSRAVRELGEEEDDFLTYVCFALLEKGYYDKATLSYLARVYCGATADMRFVWEKAKKYEIPSKNLAERIITQMLFSESMFREEQIFEDYYVGKPYFRLKQAYFAYVAKEYVVMEREVDKRIFQMMLKEVFDKEYLADICKVALLKLFAGREVEPRIANVLYEFMQDCCEKGLVFPFYLKYPSDWLRKLQLYDKTLVSYRARSGGKVEIVYQICEGDTESIRYRRESMIPVYENLYVKEFVLYQNESLRYNFSETVDGQEITTPKAVVGPSAENTSVGRYGQLNRLSIVPTDDLKEAMREYRQEDEIARRVFRIQ